MGFHKDWDSLRKESNLFQIQIPDSTLSDMQIALGKLGISKKSIYPNIAPIVKRYNLQYDEAPTLQRQVATNPVRMSWRDR